MAETFFAKTCQSNLRSCQGSTFFDSSLCFSLFFPNSATTLETRGKLSTINFWAYRKSPNWYQRKVSKIHSNFNHFSFSPKGPGADLHYFFSKSVWQIPFRITFDELNSFQLKFSQYCKPNFADGVNAQYSSLTLATLVLDAESLFSHD